MLKDIWLTLVRLKIFSNVDRQEYYLFFIKAYSASRKFLKNCTWEHLGAKVLESGEKLLKIKCSACRKHGTKKKKIPVDPDEIFYLCLILVKCWTFNSSSYPCVAKYLEVCIWFSGIYCKAAYKFGHVWRGFSRDQKRKTETIGHYWRYGTLQSSITDARNTGSTLFLLSVFSLA